MKVSRKVSLEIKEEEFYQFAKPLVFGQELIEKVEKELNQCLDGIINGDWGGTSQDWKHIFYEQLYKDGIIEQTELSIQTYGRFENGT